jgi:hypothetical protein
LWPPANRPISRAPRAGAAGAEIVDARGVADLARAIGEASVRRLEPVRPMAGSEPGNLTVKGASGRGHAVTDAATGAEVGEISSFKSTIRVPQGIYNVAFGEGLWRGVEVAPGGVTVLEPAVLSIEGASPAGHKVLDSETGREIDQLSSFGSTLPILPGLYDITFGGAFWRYVRLDPGVTTRLRPSILHVEGATGRGHDVFDATGAKVGNVSSFGSRMPLPPGSYSVDLGGKRTPFALKEGETVTLRPGGG